MGIVENVDPDGLLEYSVVFTDRSLNSMSKSFQQVMRDISAGLKEAYQAEACVLIPGGGTFCDGGDCSAIWRRSGLSGGS